MGSVTPLVLSRNMLHLVISSSYSEGMIFSFVYNPQVLSAQVQVWKELSKLAKIGIPWMVVGDFNAISSVELQSLCS